MAKKEKVELTPEQLEAKKIKKQKKSENWTRVWAVVLAAVIVVGISGLAKSNAGKVKTVNGETTTSAVTTTAANDPFASEDTTAAAANGTATTAAVAAGATVAATASKADALKMVNQAISSAVSAKAGYKWSKTSAYTGDGMKLDSSIIEKAANGILGKLNPPTSVSDVVSGFIGIGTKTSTVAKGSTLGVIDGNENGDKMKDSEAMAACAITEADVTNFKVTGNTVLIQISNCSDPQRDKASSMSRATNDFLTKADVDAALAAQDDVPATCKSATVNFTNIYITAVVDNGKLTSLKIAYDWSAAVTINLGVNASGTGTAKTEINYTNIAY